MLDTPKQNRVLQIIGVLIMGASVAVVLFSGASVISMDSVKERLDQFAAHVYEHASKDGKEGTFTYGAIEIQGWGFSKYATIENVSIAMAQKSLLDTTRWTFSTTRMEVLPDPVNASNLIFVFPEPINVIKNSQLTSTVSFSQPLKYAYLNGQENKTHTVRHTLYMPPQVTLTPGRAVDSTVAARHISITYDANPLVRFTSLPEKFEREAMYAFSHIKATSDDGSEVTMESIASSFNEKPGTDGRPLGNYTLQVNDLQLKDAKRTTKPYSLNIDIGYRGDQPQLTFRDLVPAAGNTEVTLNQMVLASDDFRIKASGAFALSVDDPLPFGAVQLDIENVKQFLASELLPDAARKALVTGVQKATGHPVATLTNVTLPMKREMNGVMHVGTVTFEELAASILAEMMQPPRRPTVLPPPLPSEQSAPAAGAAPTLPAKEIK